MPIKKEEDSPLKSSLSHVSEEEEEVNLPPPIIEFMESSQARSAEVGVGSDRSSDRYCVRRRRRCRRPLSTSGAATM